MPLRGLPTKNTSIVMLAWAPRSEVSSPSWLGVDPIFGAPAEPSPKRELSSGGAVSADHARRRKLREHAGTRGGAAVVGARRRRLTAFSPVPGAREPAAWTRGLTERTSQRLIAGRTR